jgi:hypothetical protein
VEIIGYFSRKDYDFFPKISFGKEKMVGGTEANCCFTKVDVGKIEYGALAFLIGIAVFLH